jgi:hypothetical protein
LIFEREVDEGIIVIVLLFGQLEKAVCLFGLLDGFALALDGARAGGESRVGSVGGELGSSPFFGNFLRWGRQKLVLLADDSSGEVGWRGGRETKEWKAARKG